MLKSFLLPQREKKNRTACFPHPPKPCLQSPHPVADRLSGVAARRGRRFGWRKDVRRHPEGPRGNWSPSGDTGEAAGLSDRSCRLQPKRAPDVPVRHARERASIAWRLRGYPRFARCRWRPPACPQSPPSQRDRSRRQKPPNGAPEGVILNYPIRGTAGAPSEHFTVTTTRPRAWVDVWHDSAAFLLPRREKKRFQHLSAS